jgi:hypothetical protein
MSRLLLAILKTGFRLSWAPGRTIPCGCEELLHLSLESSSNGPVLKDDPAETILPEGERGA